MYSTPGDYSGHYPPDASGCCCKATGADQRYTGSFHPTGIQERNTHAILVRQDEDEEEEAIRFVVDLSDYLLGAAVAYLFIIFLIVACWAILFLPENT